MIDPPDNDGEVPPRFLELIDELLAEQSHDTLPSSLEPRRAHPRMPKRFVVYGAVAAAAILLAVVGLAALRDSGISSVDTERAAIPTSPATSDSLLGVAGDATRAQIAADAEIAARFGLTLGPQVLGEDSSFALADQPDLTPVYDIDVLVGYAHRRDIDPTNQVRRFVVYGPDGVTVRGVFDDQNGFVATTDPSTGPED